MIQLTDHRSVLTTMSQILLARFMLKVFLFYFPAPVATEIPDGVDDDDALDMFADTLDKSEEKAPATSEKPTDTSAQTTILDDQVSWEYKWSREDEKVHGPHR